MKSHVQYNQENEGVYLDQLLLDSPGTSYLLKANNSLEKVGIREGDYVVIDAKRQPRVGDIVIVCDKGKWIVKENDETIPETDQNGVVTSVIRKLY